VLSVALTGNIASGKSHVLHLFKQWGAATTDADAIVHDLQRKGTPVYRAIVSRFGPEFVAADGDLDRAALRRLVFNDADARRDLERIVHPAVRERTATLAREARAAGAELIVHDIPLLFESADPAAFDRVVLVDAPESVRRDRLVRLRGLDPALADQLIAAQIPSPDKRARSDFVIVNDGSLADLEARTREVWTRLQREAQSPDRQIAGSPDILDPG
jgi:dephospho-CoA kinase